MHERQISLACRASLFMILFSTISYARPNPVASPFLSLSSAPSPLANPLPSPALKCSPSSPSCSWSKIVVGRWVSKGVEIDTSILTSSFSSPTSSSLSSDTQSTNSPARINQTDLRGSRERHRHVITIVLSVSLTALFVGFVLLGFLFCRRRSDCKEGAADEGESENKELKSTDCFMRKVEVGASLASGSRNGSGKSKGSVYLNGSSKKSKSDEVEEEGKGKGKKFGEWERSEETLGVTDGGGEKKWSFEGGDDIAPVRKEEYGTWRFCRSEDSLSTPTTAQTDRDDGEKKWSFDRSEETLALSPASQHGARWYEEKGYDIHDIANVAKSNDADISNTGKRTPSRSFRSNMQIHPALRIEIVKVESQEVEDLISPLDLNQSTLAPQVEHICRSNKRCSKIYGGEAMLRSQSPFSLLPVERSQENKTCSPKKGEEQKEMRDGCGGKMHQYQENELWEEVELCVGSPPRVKDSGFWSLEDGMLGIENNGIDKRRGGRDLWDLFVTL